MSVLWAKGGLKLSFYFSVCHWVLVIINDDQTYFHVPYFVNCYLCPLLFVFFTWKLLFSDLLLIMVSILIITVSLQNFSLSTFFFPLCLHIVFHFFMFAFDFNCETTLLTVSYYASQDTLLWAEDMCIVLQNALSKMEYLLPWSASYKST